MVAEVKTKIYTNRQGKVFIFLPKKLTQDSAFPFQPGDQIIIRIEGGRLVIEKA